MLGKHLLSHKGTRRMLLFPLATDGVSKRKTLETSLGSSPVMFRDKLNYLTCKYFSSNWKLCG